MRCNHYKGCNHCIGFAPLPHANDLFSRFTFNDLTVGHKTRPDRYLRSWEVLIPTSFYGAHLGQPCRIAENLHEDKNKCNEYIILSFFLPRSSFVCDGTYWGQREELKVRLGQEDSGQKEDIESLMQLRWLIWGWASLPSYRKLNHGCGQKSLPSWPKVDQVDQKLTMLTKLTKNTHRVAKSWPIGVGKKLV